MTIRRSWKWPTLSFEDWDRLVESNEKVKGDRVSVRIMPLGLWTPVIIVWDEWRTD